MELTLPPKPEKPLDSDCCGQGCDPCILDIYQEELRIWEAECCQIRTGVIKPDKEDDCFQKASDASLCQTEYNTFEVEEVFVETCNCNRYRFRLPKGAVLGLKAGQHVVIRSEISGEVVTRQYTPVSHIDQKSYFELLIKIYENGKMSQSIKHWNVGSKVQMRGPCGLYQYVPNKYRVMYMFAVGTGIAPMAQIIQSVLGNENDETVIQLHFGCQTYCDIPLKAWLDEWTKFWNFSCTYYLSQEPSDDNCNYKYGDTVKKNRISLDIVRTIVNMDLDNSFVLICGTKSFEKDMIECLNNMGLSKERIHKF